MKTAIISVTLLLGMLCISVCAVEDHKDGKDHHEIPTEESKPSPPNTHGAPEYLPYSVRDDLYSLLEKQKRFRTIVGRGFSLGKRHRPDAPESREDQDNDQGDNDGEMEGLHRTDEDNRWFTPEHDDERYPYRRSKRSKRFANYYGSMLGKGFAFGKRHDYDRFMDSEESDKYDTDEPEIEKRFFGGGILGRGYMLGKRHIPNRLFGNILGGGFSTKRSHGFEEPHERDESTDKDSMEDLESSEAGPEHDQYFRREFDDDESNDDYFKSKRYFHSSPGYRFLFGKRSGRDFNKRYGFLGRFHFGGKRFHNDLPNHFGSVLGNGFVLGKRSWEQEASFDPEDSFSMEDERDYPPHTDDGFLGRGYLVNKRGLKRFGYVLGSGWKFGKRSGDKRPIPEYDVYYFIDDDGNILKMNDEEGDPEGYKGEDAGDSYELVDFRPYLEENKDVFNDEQKRAIGYVLGRGLSFGKRAASYKRFGHVLGHGFAFGK